MPVLPRLDDPGKRLVEDIARHVDRLGALPGEIEAQLAPVLVEVRGLAADVRRAADKPVLTSQQIRYDVLPGVLAAADLLRLVIVVGLLLAAGGAGYAVCWWGEPALDCEHASLQGRAICYRYIGPPVTQDVRRK